MTESEQFLQIPATQVLPDGAANSPSGKEQSSNKKGNAWPTIPGYEIFGELGRGGMGVVYLARQTALKRLVALKMILAGAEAALKVRFCTEAEAVARLRHPNIVQIYEVGEYDGRPFLTLEYVEGGNLQDKAARKAQPDREAAKLVETLARAMHYTHEHGILHRDLKPNNILLTADGTPKITDFGLAKLLDQGGGPTRAEALIGTPNYMPPEQAAGNLKKIGVPSDVYSLGAILYELLTGRAPFHGTTLLNTLEQVRTQEPVSPRRLRRPIARDLETICLKCLEKEPEKRYPSALALAEELSRYLEGKSIQARPLPLWQHLWRSARRHPAKVATAFASIVLVCLAVASWLYLHATDELERHNSEERYQQFVRHRNDALFYGLLGREHGAQFLGTDADVNFRKAQAAAYEALNLAGVLDDAGKPSASLPVERKRLVDTDCYAILLVLAGIQRDKREALVTLERARGLGPDSRAVYLRRAALLEELGNSAEAAGDRAKAARLPSTGALDHFLEGEEQYRQGEWTGAKASFQRALGVAPDHFWARFLLAVCHLQTRHWEAARSGLDACLAQQPGFVWAHLLRSFANEKLNALPEAENDLRQALRLDPNDDARYVLLLARGVLYFGQKKLQPAADDFRSAMQLRPAQYNAYVNLAQTYLALGQVDDAAELMRRAIELDPPPQVVVGYHVERAQSLLRERNYEKALEACAAALAISPTHALAYEVSGRALFALAHYKEAERALDQYLKYGGEAGFDVFRCRGLTRMKLAKYAAAAEDFSRALDRSNDADLYVQRGWAHFFADAWALALRDFALAVELEPESAEAFTGRGLARVMLGGYREAVVDAAEALRLKPATPEMMHNTACIFGLAALRVLDDGAETNHDALAKIYRAQAVDIVSQTLALLPRRQRAAFLRDKIIPDPALAAVRAELGHLLPAEE